MSEGIFRRCINQDDVYRLLMIEFLNIQSAFEHYKRVLGSNGPVETRAKYHDDRLYVEHYHAYTGQFIIGAVFIKEPAAIRIFSLACCLDHHDASAQDPILGPISNPASK